MIMQKRGHSLRQPGRSYDAVKMLTNVWVDVANSRWSRTLQPVILSAPARWWKVRGCAQSANHSSVGTFVVNRNDTSLARRVEAIRLPGASKKSAVLLRFSHYGSCGWEWAVDNIAFYDIAPALPPPIQSRLDRSW
jgi:hypothetical protein